MPRKSVSERFWEKVHKFDEGCWFWIGARRSYGYGGFWNGHRQVQAHRWAYEDSIGPIPTGLTLDHLCKNRRCVNPAHLEPVTNRENILRGDSPSAQNARKTHCIYGHELTVENVYLEPPDGRRKCRICRRRKEREIYWRNRGREAAPGEAEMGSTFREAE